MQKTKSRVLAILLAFIIVTSNVGHIFAATKQELEQELAKIEQQIAQFEKDLANTKTEKQTLQNKINQLKKQQASITLQIRATTIQINELGNQIDGTEQTINDIEKRIGNLREQIKILVRSMYDNQQRSLMEVMVADGGISGLFTEIDNLQKISDSLNLKLGEFKGLKIKHEQQLVQLEDQKTDAQTLLNLQALQQKELASRTNEQNQLLRDTQGKEAAYQAMLAEARKNANEIRNRLYDLLGVSKQVTFGEAVEIAKYVSQLTGIRPAFLLAVLTQESNLGKNVGTCNRAGDPPEKSWKVVMKPTRDQEPFKQVTSELGLDIDTTPVSCPMRDKQGNQIGWGGAMGPAQFIPSTWMGYRDKVSAITGKPANPWDIKDAMLAAGIKLVAGGATKNGEDGEWRAAMIYFSGSTNTRFRFYGDNILAIARRYQADIEALQ